MRPFIEWQVYSVNEDTYRRKATRNEGDHRSQVVDHAWVVDRNRAAVEPPTGLESDSMAKTFKLKFHPSQIHALSARFSFDNDFKALKAGKKIGAGDYSLQNLRKIVEWKSPRSTSRFDVADLEET